MEQIMEMVAEIIATWKLMLAEMNADREERTPHQEATEATPEKMEPNPEKLQANPVKMKSVTVHEEFHMENAAVKPSGTMKKRQRDWHQAVG
jgi:hypothetical protein